MFMNLTQDTSDWTAGTDADPAEGWSGKYLLLLFRVSFRVSSDMHSLYKNKCQASCTNVFCGFLGVSFTAVVCWTHICKKGCFSE